MAVGHHRPQVPTSPRSPLVNTRSRYPRVPIVLPPTPRAAHAHRTYPPSETQPPGSKSLTVAVRLVGAAVAARGQQPPPPQASQTPPPTADDAEAAAAALARRPSPYYPSHSQQRSG